MKIDFVSDVSCPWCAIGLHALEQALARFDPPLPVSLHFQPFELNPGMAAGGQDIVEHLSQKYGIDEAQIRRNQEAIRQRGASVGFTFGEGKRSRIYNTFDAHRLLHWAGLPEQPEGAQAALKHALLAAYFTDGEDPSRHELLVRLAAAVGLDPQRARAILDGSDYAEAVRERERWYTDRGIHSVPAVIIDDRHLISGGQPVEVFEDALRRLSTAVA
jgi:predicted DsbA family dithiol-disulfide isomerase